jgi:hypothetical protein
MNLPSRYEIRQTLPETPLERTFLAFDTLLQREVMLKLPGAGAAEWTTSVREALLREARALAKVRHAAIAPILHVDETAEGPLLVLEPPAGETLAERLQRGPLTTSETITLGITIADALAAVHYAGIVHRAIGPNAIRLHADGGIELAAFTFAKAAGHEQRSSLAHAARNQPEVARWLPDYSAPEQLAGLPAEPRSDLYALGCTLFRCLAGRDAFEPGHEHEPMADLRRSAPGVPKELSELIRKCAAHGKTARFTTALDVKTALTKLSQPATKPSRRRAFLALAGIATTVLIAAFWPRQGGGEPTSRGGADADIATEDRRYNDSYGSGYGHVYGLFVAIGQGYDNAQWPKLQNPVHEVTEIADQLRANDPQWAADGAITILKDENATYANIAAAMQQIAAKATKEDGVLFYFSGHGTRDGESFGLCAQDVSGTVANGMNYLRRDVLLTWLKRDLLAKHALVVLDCCHSGAVFSQGLMRGELPPSRTAVSGAQHRSRFAREFLCSSAAAQKASDGAAMSPFCQKLLAELRQPATAERPFVAARFLASRIAESMDTDSARVGRLQTPCFRDMAEQQGSFVFLLRKGR